MFGSRKRSRCWFKVAGWIHFFFQQENSFSQTSKLNTSGVEDRSMSTAANHSPQKWKYFPPVDSHNNHSSQRRNNHSLGFVAKRTEPLNPITQIVGCTQKSTETDEKAKFDEMVCGETTRVSNKACNLHMNFSWAVVLRWTMDNNIVLSPSRHVHHFSSLLSFSFQAFMSRLVWLLINRWNYSNDNDGAHSLIKSPAIHTEPVPNPEPVLCPTA